MPGAKAPIRYPRTTWTSGQEFLHPDAWARTRSTRSRCWRSTRETGKHPLGEGRPTKGRPTTTATRPELRVADAGHGRRARLRLLRVGRASIAYDFDGKLAWKADLGDIATHRHRLRHLAGAATATWSSCSATRTTATTSFIVALDKKTGKEVWRIARKVQVSWATPVLVEAGGRDRARDQRHRVHHRLRPRDRARSCGGRRASRATPIPTPVVGHGPGRALRGLPGEGAPWPSGRAAAATSRARRASSGTTTKGTAYVPVADPVRRLRVPGDRQRASSRASTRRPGR